MVRSADMASCNFGCRSATLDGATEWQTVLADAVRSPSELGRRLGLDLALVRAAEAAAAGFPLLVPQPYLDRMQPGDPADPLLLQVLPQGAELDTVPGYSDDPLAEAAAMPAPCLLRKYRGRSLMVASGACGVHCRFCFRRHFPYINDDFAFGPALQTIAADPSTHEVILSGGDPLMLDDRQLGDLIAELAEIPHLKRVRVHTRLPVAIPQRITGELVHLLRGSRLAAIVVLHVNHPAEIDEPVAAAFARLIDAGIPVLSQSVLLQGVNDRVEVLAALCERLVDLRVMPYYLHQLDHVAGASHFEVPVATGINLVEALRARLPGYAMPRYVQETVGGAYKEPLA